MIRHIADDNPTAHINGSPIIADAIPSENIITIRVCSMITPDKMGDSQSPVMIRLRTGTYRLR